MKQKSIQVHFRMTEKEHQQFLRNVKKCGLSQSGYFRHLVKGYEPKALPPLEYGEIIKLLSDSYNLLLQRNDPKAADQILNLVRLLTEAISPMKGGK
jgi:hypothetical protein